MVIELWYKVGTAFVTVSAVKINTIKIRVNQVYAGNTQMSWRELWFDPTNSIFLKSRGSLEYRGEIDWDIIDVVDCPLCRLGARGLAPSFPE